LPQYLEKRGNNKTCSDKCRKLFMHGRNNPNFKNRQIKVKCQECGKEFFTRMHRLKQQRGKFCSLLCARVYQFRHQKNKNTQIELAIKKELESRNIPFMEQVPIKEAKTIVDFLLPNKIIIYCDGDYWHNLPHIKERDFNRNYWLNFLGYTVFRFTETEIKKSASQCVDIIQKKFL